MARKVWTVIRTVTETYSVASEDRHTARRTCEQKTTIPNAVIVRSRVTFDAETTAMLNGEKPKRKR